MGGEVVGGVWEKGGVASFDDLLFAYAYRGEGTSRALLSWERTSGRRQAHHLGVDIEVGLVILELPETGALWSVGEVP